MEKIVKYPRDEQFRAFHPSSVVLVTAVDAAGKEDICTVGAWSLVNGAPHLYGIALCTQTVPPRFFKRYTTACIEQTGEFAINIPHLGLEEAWEFCGTHSLTKEPDLDKFKGAGLTRGKPATIRASVIAECPVNIECRVHSVLNLPSHDWIVGEPVAIHTARDVMQGAKELKWERAVRFA